MRASAPSARPLLAPPAAPPQVRAARGRARGRWSNCPGVGCCGAPLAFGSRCSSEDLVQRMSHCATL
eukprot:6555902-Alexandrium_andersonii.AAC.1